MMSDAYVQMARQYDRDATTIPTTPIEVIRTADAHGSMHVDREANLAYAKELRKEFYGLVAVLVRDTFDIAAADVDQNKPYGLLKDPSQPVTSLKSFDDLTKSMTFTLRRARNPIRVAEHRGNDPIVNRVKDIGRVFFAASNDFRYASPYNLVGSGINTGVEGAVQSAMAVNRVVKKAVPIAMPEDVITIARNSGRLASRLTAASLNHLYPGFAVTMTAAGGDTFLSLNGKVNEEYMKLIKTPVEGLGLFRDHRGELYVDFLQPLTETPSPLEIDEVIGDMPVTFETLGCPARAKLGQGPTVEQRLWRWTIDVVEKAGLFA